MTGDLFAELEAPSRQALGPQAVLLRRFAAELDAQLMAAVAEVACQSEFRHMVTPGGFTMSVAMTNCGALGWTSDRRGYRYTGVDPVTGRPWPAMPDLLRTLARAAAAEAGFADFHADACLINRYLPGHRLTLHQDRNEQDFTAPIVSILLGMPAVFLFGGQERSDKPNRIALMHGDVVVWGGVDRLRYHGIAPLKDQPHALLGSQRLNLTLRRAG